MLLKWQRKTESASLAFLALHPNLPTMLFNEVFAKEQSQTAAGFVFGSPAVGLNIEPE